MGGLIYDEKNIEDEDQLKDLLLGTQNHLKDGDELPAFLGIGEEGGDVAPVATKLDLTTFAPAAELGTSEDLDGAEYTPVALMATQVVAGMNYCILCQITPVAPDAEPTWALVYIYADLQGNAEIMNVYELYIAQHSTPKPQQ